MKWLHLSDIHYNPQNDGRSTHQLRAKLPRYIIDKHIKADHLFITGDFRHAKHQPDDAGITAANTVQFIIEIADAAQVAYENIHIIPGNHDLTRARNAKDIEKLNQIKNNYNAHNGRFYGNDISFLFERFCFYRQIESELKKRGGVIHCPLDQFKTHGYYNLSDCCLLYLNTCLVCNSDDDRGNLIIGNYDLYQCLEELKQKYPNKPVIILAHHGTDNFRPDEKKAVEQLFEDYSIKLYLCGDAHTPWRRSTNGIMEITMGGLIQADKVRTVFSVGELNNGKWAIKAHEWDADTSRWGEYTQLNDELREAFSIESLAEDIEYDPMHAQLRNHFERVRKRDKKNVTNEAISLAHKLWNEYQDGYAGIYLLDLARLHNDFVTVKKLYAELSKSADLMVRMTAKKWYEKWGD